MIVFVVKIVTRSIFTRNESPAVVVRLIKIRIAVSRPRARSAMVLMSEKASDVAPKKTIDDEMRTVPAKGAAEGDAGGKLDDKRGALGDCRLETSKTSFDVKDRE